MLLFSVLLILVIFLVLFVNEWVANLDWGNILNEPSDSHIFFFFLLLVNNCLPLP